MNDLPQNNQAETLNSASNAIADIRDFGAVEADNADALEAAILSGKIVKIPAGDWRIATNKTIVPEFDVKIVGEVGARLKFDNALWQFMGKQIRGEQSGKTELTRDASRGDMSVTLNDTTGIQPNDIIVIYNNTVAETQWNYKKSCTSLVTKVCDNNVKLAHPLNFDFGVEEPNNSVAVYRSNYRVTFENIIIHAQSIVPTEPRIINFQGLKNVMLRNIVQENNGLNTYTINFLSCVDCHVENSTIFTGTYPYLVNLSRDMTFNNLKAYDAHHAVSPATWTDTVYINNLFTRGCSGGVESHPAFNIHYANVDVCDKNTYSNLRCVGGSIRNGVIRHVGDSSSGPYFHNVELVDKSIYDDYDFVVEGLLYDQDDKLFGPSYGRRFIARDSEFKGGLHMGGRGVIKEVHLDSCIYGLFFARALPLLNTHNTTQHFELNEDRYELRLYEGKVSYTKNKVYAQGDIFTENSTDPIEVTLRVYDHWLQEGLPFISGILKLRAWVRHGNAGGFDILEHHYHFFHKIAATSAIVFGKSPAFASNPTGQANESLTIQIPEKDEEYHQQGGSQSTDFREHYFELKVTISSSRTNPTYGLNYELELFRG